MGSGGGGNQTTTQVDPYRPAQPYIDQGLADLGNLYQQGPGGFYPGSTVTPFSPITEDYLGAMRDRSMGSGAEGALGQYIGSAIGQQQVDLQPGVAGAGQAIGGLGIGQSALGQTASGAMLNSNPYLDQMFGQASGQVRDQFNQSVLPGINATFGGAGRTGSGIHQQTLGNAAGELGDTLGGLATDIYGGNYARERQNQMSAAGQLQQGGLSGVGHLGGLFGQASQRQAQGAGMVPTLSGIEWQNIDRLGQVGQAVDQQAQNHLQDQINRHNYANQAPWDHISRYMQIAGQPYGSSTVNTGPQGSPVGSALGGAASGAGLGAMTGNPFIAGAGGVAGGLAGLLGGK